MVSFPALQTLSSLRDRESDSALTSDGDLRDRRIVPYTPGKCKNKVYLNVWVIILRSSGGLKQEKWGEVIAIFSPAWFIQEALPSVLLCFLKALFFNLL